MGKGHVVTNTIVLEEKKGLWIEEHLLRQARLETPLQVVVGNQEIRILPVSTSSRKTSSPQAILNQVREEALGLYGGQAPPVNRPYFGGITWPEYRSLSPQEQQALWDRLYASFDTEIDVIEERDVRPDARVA